jgi:hypothetical protein
MGNTNSMLTTLVTLRVRSTPFSYPELLDPAQAVAKLVLSGVAEQQPGLSAAMPCNPIPVEDPSIWIRVSSIALLPRAAAALVVVKKADHLPDSKRG